MSSPTRKNISVFPNRQISLYLIPSRPCQEGRIAIVTDGRWRQVPEKRSFLGATVANKPGRRGERGGNRKTIAQGMSDCLHCPVCSCAIFFLPFARETADAA